MAWVKLRPTATGSETDLAAFCDARLSNFKLPRYWKFVDGFPMTVTGKVQQFKMREVAIQELGLAMLLESRPRGTNPVRDLRRPRRAY